MLCISCPEDIGRLKCMMDPPSKCPIWQPHRSPQPPIYRVYNLTRLERLATTASMRASVALVPALLLETPFRRVVDAQPARSRRARVRDGDVPRTTTLHGVGSTRADRRGRGVGVEHRVNVRYPRGQSFMCTSRVTTGSNPLLLAPRKTRRQAVTL